MHWTDRIQPAFPVVVCALLSCAAYFQARAATWLVASELTEAPAVSQPAPLPDVAPRAPSATPILKRNPFDSVTGPLDGEPPAPAPEPRPPVPMRPQDAPKCDFGHVTLIALAGSRRPLASILTKDGKSRLVRLGEEISEHTLELAAYNRVWLRSASAICQMRLGDRVVQKPVKRPRPRPRRVRRKPSTRLPPALANKIQRVSATEYRVDRSAVDALLEQQAQLMRGTRLRPVKRGSEVVGLRVFRVRTGTLLYTLGVRNGDVIKGVNGFDLTNPQKALEAYGRLRTADNLKLQLERRGQPVTIEYQIH